ncbi:MAG: hypothetical protein GY913_22495 [Proteobacteria bacterium]|nr:hypothetical protein [Pseudomonadota bacterium]MCP4919680.1 hypothetical protein [Pseudomonadota bacterium]
MERLLVPALLALVLLLGWAAPLVDGPFDVALGTAEGAVPLAFAALWRGAQGLLETGPFGMSADVGWPGSLSGVREDPSRW